MFTKATVRLTAWYVAILMALSLVFTSWLYAEATQEVRTGLSAQLLRPIVGILPRQDVNNFLDKQYNASRTRIIGSLVLLNVGVLCAGSVLSYLLARRTLRPIEQALHAQNRFTADASHELRTPLTTMKTELEVALRDPNLTTKETQTLLKSNVEEIDRLSHLADGLLILARTGDKPTLVPLPLEPITAKTLSRFTILAMQKHVTLTYHKAAITVLGDASQIDTVVGILLDNAIKYCAEKSTVTLALATQDGHACITVHNQGPGISAEDLPHIFDRFYRADTSRTKGATPGHGLGLSIAQKLADTMGGSIAVKSDTATGITFTLRVALAPRNS